MSRFALSVARQNGSDLPTFFVYEVLSAFSEMSTWPRAQALQVATNGHPQVTRHHIRRLY